MQQISQLVLPIELTSFGLYYYLVQYRPSHILASLVSETKTVDVD